MTTDLRAKQTQCKPSNINESEINFIFMDLISGMRYVISVRTCVRVDDCRLEPIVVGFGLNEVRFPHTNAILFYIHGVVLFSPKSNL